MSKLTVEAAIMYIVVAGVVIYTGIFLYREAKKKLAESDITVEEYERNTKYKQLLNKLEAIASEHPSRKKQVLVRRMRQSVQAGHKSPEETINELIEVAYEVHSRSRTPFGRALISGREEILKQLGR